MSNIISYPGIQELEANDLMLITDVSKDDKPLRSISIGRLATYIEGGGGTSTSINGEIGAITFVAGNNVTIDKVGKTFTINSAGGGGGGGIGGLGTPGYISHWKTADTIGDSLMYDDGIGISIGAAGSVAGSQLYTLANGTSTGTFVNFVSDAVITRPSDDAGSLAWGSVSKITSAGDFADGGVMGINCSGNKEGAGDAYYVYGAFTTSTHKGSGKIDFLTASLNQTFITGEDASEVDKLAGIISEVSVDNPNTTIDEITAGTFRVRQNQATARNINVIDLNYSTDGTGTPSTTGDFSYIKIVAGDPASVGGTARAINSETVLPSEFKGSVEATSFIKTGGQATEYLMADGSVTTGGGGGGTITIDASADTIFAASSMTIAAKSAASDKIVFWDNSASELNYLTVGSGLSLSGTTLTATGGGSTQNLFETIAVAGQDSIVADSATDTLNLAAGTGIELTTNALTDTVTIAATGGGGGADTNEIAFFVEWPSSDTSVTNLSPMADWDISGMQWQWNYDGATGRYLLECKSEDWFDWGYRVTMNANLNAFSNGKLIQVEMLRISKSSILVEAFQIDGTGVQRHDIINTDMRGPDIEPELGSFPQGLDIRIKRWPITV